MKLPKLRRKDKLSYRVFVVLGILCVFNLNAIAGNYLGMERIFSPFILLFCVLGIAISTKRPITDLGKFGLWFVGGIIAYTGFGVLSGFMNGNISLMPIELMAYAASIGVATATIYLGRRLILAGQIERVIRFLFWMSLASSATVFISYVIPSLNKAVTTSHADGRYSGFFANPNELATQTLLAAAFGFLLAARTLNIKYIAYTLIVCVPAMLGSHSRSGIVGLAFTIFVMSFLVFPPKYVIRSSFALVAMGLVGFFGINYLQSLTESGSRGLQNRTEELFSFFQGNISGETTGMRYELGEEAIGLFFQAPIMGHGLGYMNRMPQHGLGPHNMILKMLGDSGISGTMILGAFWITFFTTAVRCRIHWLRVGLIGIFLAVSFNLVSGHTGLSRRFIIFQLAALVVMMEPSLQKIIQSGTSNAKKIILRSRQPMPQPGLHQPYHHPIQHR